QTLRRVRLTKHHIRLIEPLVALPRDQHRRRPLLRKDHAMSRQSLDQQGLRFLPQRRIAPNRKTHAPPHPKVARASSLHPFQPPRYQPLPISPPSVALCATSFRLCVTTPSPPSQPSSPPSPL